MGDSSIYSLIETCLLGEMLSFYFFSDYFLAIDFTSGAIETFEL